MMSWDVSDLTHGGEGAFVAHEEVMAHQPFAVLILRELSTRSAMVRFSKNSLRD